MDTFMRRESSVSPRVSVVVPIRNEAGNITSLDREIRDALLILGVTAEVIYINDGSTDGSLAELMHLKDAIIIDLNRNYGQATALDAGFKAARGKIVVSMDGDGQNDPHDMIPLIKKLEHERLDVVAGWRKDRKDKGNIRVLTRIGRAFRHILISDTVHDTGCTLRAYRIEAVQALDIGGEMHRYILALLRWKGFKIGELVVNHRVRRHGVSKYGMSKALRGMIDLLYIWFIHKYSQRPLHLFGYIAALSGLFSTLAIGWAVYGKLFFGLSLNRNGWFFLGFFFLLASIMLFSFGIIVDLLIRIQLTTSPHEKRYYVREIIET
jgi:glycosyltransferase involved in cell wall biosynthesis